jgi:phosphonate transport system substrate-binding protein
VEESELSNIALRFATFLAPNMLPVYEFITAYVGKKLGCNTELIVGSSFDQFQAGRADVGFICGLPYVQLARHSPPPVELVAAPVLQGERYQGRPIYFSDVIVRCDSPFQRFSDLRGRTWSYNDLDSHSGYNVTRYRLVQMGETNGFFGQVIQAGWHQKSIRMVIEGTVDASAIDSQVLAVELRDNPAWALQLRVIDSLGPSSIQPAVAARQLPEHVRADVRSVLLGMGDDANAKTALAYGFVERFASVTDSTYDDIRAMLFAAEAAGFMTLK